MGVGMGVGDEDTGVGLGTWDLGPGSWDFGALGTWGRGRGPRLDFFRLPAVPALSLNLNLTPTLSPHQGPGPVPGPGHLAGARQTPTKYNRDT